MNEGIPHVEAPGSITSAEMKEFCIRCGQEFIGGSMFCVRCGEKKILQSAAVPATPVTNAPEAVSISSAIPDALAVSATVSETAPEPRPISPVTPLDTAAQKEFCSKCGTPFIGVETYCTICGEKRVLLQTPPQTGQAIPNTQPTYAQSQSLSQMPIGGFFSFGEYMIDEKISAFQFTNAYKVFGVNGNQIGTVDQEKISGGAKAARLLLGSGAKALQSFKLDIKDNSGMTMVSIQRGGMGSAGGIRSINLSDGSGRSIGTIRLLFSMWTPKLEIFSTDGTSIGKIEGDWKGWNFTITDIAGNIIGTVNKKWSGAMREIFTTADKYHVSISPQAAGAYRMAIVSAAITLDMVLKEFK